MLNRFLGTISSNILILVGVNTDTVELVQSYNVGSPVFIFYLNGLILKAPVS